MGEMHCNERRIGSACGQCWTQSQQPAAAAAATAQLTLLQPLFGIALAKYVPEIKPTDMGQTNHNQNNVFVYIHLFRNFQSYCLCSKMDAFQFGCVLFYFANLERQRERYVGLFCNIGL